MLATINEADVAQKLAAEGLNFPKLERLTVKGSLNDEMRDLLRDRFRHCVVSFAER